MPKGIANPQPLRCLVRSPDGWWVQLTRNGIEHRHCFKFGANRSESEALALAQARRDQLMQEHPEVPGWRAIERAICNDKPGGVAYVTGPDKQSGYWCAETPMVVARPCARLSASSALQGQPSKWPSPNASGS
jgi:hypothetical protein